MRIAVGGLLFEGNTFSPVIATRADFTSKYLVEGAEVVAKLAGTGTEIGGAIDEIRDARDEILPLVATHGGAGGRVASAVTAELCGALLERIAALPPVDGLYLALHGAFVSQDSLDVDGALLTKVRALLPNTPIVVSCDLHAHITDAMLANCDALIGYKHYPHDDTYETGRRAVAMLREIAAGTLRPVLVACRAPMIAPAQNQRTRGEGPMVEIRALAEARSVGAIRDVSYFCVQPWIDAPGLGWTVVVTADAAGDTAAGVAREVADAMWQRRSRMVVDTIAPAAAIRHGLAIDGSVVLADASDCVGGGASGDSAAALQALLQEAPDAPAAIHIADDVTARAALAHRPGERFAVLLGNRRDKAYGAPLAVEAEFLRAAPPRFTYGGGLMRGVTAELGDAAVLRIRGTQVLVSANACYEYADEAFAAAAIDVRAGKFIVVKNPMNYQQAYADAAARFILDTPGPTTPNLAALPWRHIDRPLFPVDPTTPMALRIWSRGTGWSST